MAPKKGEVTLQTEVNNQTDEEEVHVELGDILVAVENIHRADEEFPLVKELPEDNSVEAKAKSAEEALRLLKEGNDRFRRNMNKAPTGEESIERKIQLYAGQKPHAVIVTCSDSRVPPEYIFDQDLGDIFVIRLAGNIPGEFARASILYAIEHLKSPLVVVMGHQSCGAVGATLSVHDDPSQAACLCEDLRKLVAGINVGVEQLYGPDEPEDLSLRAIVANAQHQVLALQSHPDLKKAIETHNVKVVGAYYAFNGVVTFF